MRRLLALLAALTAALPAAADARHHYSVSSTAYSPCDGSGSDGLMANGHNVHTGAVAVNFLPLGTLVRLDHAITFADRLGRRRPRRWFRVEDHIGSGSQFDIWMARCQDMNRYGRRSLSFSTR